MAVGAMGQGTVQPVPSKGLNQFRWGETGTSCPGSSALCWELGG